MGSFKKVELLLALVFAQVLLCSALHVPAAKELLKTGYEMRESGFGTVEFVKEGHTVVFQPSQPQPGRTLDQLMKDATASPSLALEPTPMPSTFFSLVPQHVATLLPGQTARWSTRCYKEVTATLTLGNDGTGLLDLHATKHDSLMCADNYLVASVSAWHLHSQLLSGHHRLEVKGLSAVELADIAANGYRVFVFPEKLTQTLKNLWDSLQMFLGGFGTGQHASVGKGQTLKNVEFLQQWANWTLVKRPTQVVELDEADIHSGDFIAILRLDGLDPMLAYGMGAHTGHTTMALRFPNGELNVCESQDGWYWPRHNIQCNPYKQWVEWAKQASYNAAVLPLAPKYRAIFNETAAYEFFKKVEGTPYGYHNLFFGWIDTENDNYVPPLSAELFMVGFALVDHLLPSISNRVWNEALNKRLQTTGLNTSELYAKAASQGISFQKLMAIPERDEWVFSDGYSMVCSSFVLEMYKASGIFGNMTSDLHGTEFTDRDVYQMAIFDSAYQRPAQCVAADAELPYCQILGEYRLELPYYNTVEPYPHMMENCPTIPPNYVYPPQC